MAQKKYTINEIADMAGVSRATVDRVLHDRGPVSSEAAERISSILEKIDYQPNLLARSLKKGQLLKIGVLLPDPKYDIYWQRAKQGLEEAKTEYTYLGVVVDTFLFNPYKEVSFNLNAKLLLKGNYDGVIVAPFFYREAIEFFSACEKAGLPYVTFNTHIEESNPLCFVGQNLVESGRTAASLLCKISDPGKDLLIIHIDEDLTNARHIQEKEKGFMAYVDECGMSVHILKIDSVSTIDQQLGSIIGEKNNIGGIYVSTSKVHYIADFLNEYLYKIPLIGYDLLDENVSYLKEGIIDFLVFQNPKMQANQALILLVDHLAFKKEIQKKKNIPAAIVLRENVDSYLEGL